MPYAATCRILLLIGFLSAVPLLSAEALPNKDSSLGAVLEGFTHRYTESVVFVRAVRPVGPDTRSLSVLGAPAPGPETVTLWSTGIVIDRQGRVLTCADGAQPTDRLAYRTLGGAELPARFVAQDAKSGLAVLEPMGSPPGTAMTPLARCASAATMRENDWVVILAPARGIESLEPRLGRLERILSATTTGGATVLRIHAEGAQSGCGALILDGNGDFLGMVVDCDPLGEGDDAWVPPILDEPTYALPRGFLLETANALANDDRDAVGFLGVQTTLLSLAEAEVDRAEISASPVEVRRVLPGSPAEQAGLVMGDLLLSIDGVAVHDVTDISEKVSGLEPGSVVRLRLLRDGVPLAVEVTIGDRSSLDWLDRKYRRNLRRERLLESGIETLQDDLESLRSLQDRFR